MFMCVYVCVCVCVCVCVHECVCVLLGGEGRGVGESICIFFNLYA